MALLAAALTKGHDADLREGAVGRREAQRTAAVSLKFKLVVHHNDSLRLRLIFFIMNSFTIVSMCVFCFHLDLYVT